ncbi:hypothetical protein VQH23_26495 (plasmid) [Pararoseomonas sp. SCSIO 73927]|uniref:hypothetical protein n=1 Tax=Pararoseomonas sp. SCSIO 73927 TaxID=3114537 RepID=UPI0030CEF792
MRIRPRGDTVHLIRERYDAARGRGVQSSLGVVALDADTLPDHLTGPGTPLTAPELAELRAWHAGRLAERRAARLAALPDTIAAAAEDLAAAMDGGHVLAPADRDRLAAALARLSRTASDALLAAALAYADAVAASVRAYEAAGHLTSAETAPVAAAIATYQSAEAAPASPAARAAAASLVGIAGKSVARIRGEIAAKQAAEQAAAQATEIVRAAGFNGGASSKAGTTGHEEGVAGTITARGGHLSKLVEYEVKASSEGRKPSNST